MKVTSFIEKDVTEIEKQLVELVKLTGQKVSSSHILDVYRGSLSQMVKKHRHETVRLHGVGKHLAKGEASRVLHHLVVEDFTAEEVKKSDFYGSVSSVLKVNKQKFHNALIGGQRIILRFPSSMKALKPVKCDLTPARGSQTSAKLNLPIDIPDEPQTEVDLSSLSRSNPHGSRSLSHADFGPSPFLVPIHHQHILNVHGSRVADFSFMVRFQFWLPVWGCHGFVSVCILVSVTGLIFHITVSVSPASVTAMPSTSSFSTVSVLFGCARNTMWTRIWCKGISLVGNLFTKLMHYIFYFLNYYIHYLVLY